MSYILKIIRISLYVSVLYSMSVFVLHRYELENYLSVCNYQQDMILATTLLNNSDAHFNDRGK